MLDLDTSAEREALEEKLLESESLKMKLLQGLVSKIQSDKQYGRGSCEPITLEVQFGEGLQAGTAGHWGRYV